MADPQKEPAAPAASKPTTQAELTAAYPDLCAGLRAEGATAERERITGIEKVGAAMKGHDVLVAEMKADGKTTPEQASMRIVLAEGAVREQQLKGVKDVEALTGKVPASPQTEDAAAVQQQEQAAGTPESWAAEFGAQTPGGAKLRSEFATKQDYVGFMANKHKVRILSRQSA